MGDFVYSQEEVVVCCASNNIRCRDEQRGRRARVSQQICGKDLKTDNKHDNIFRQGFIAHELCDLSIGAVGGKLRTNLNQASKRTSG